MMSVSGSRRIIIRQVVLAACLILVFFSLSGWFLYRNHQSLLDTMLTRHTEEQQRVWESVLQMQNKGMEAYFFSYVMQRPVLDILQESLTADEQGKQIARVRLYRELYNAYVQLKVQGVHQFHFHDPESRSMLRFHLPQHAGDSLIGVRKTVELANATLQPVHRFEGGRAGSGFRNVFPVIDGRDHLGSAELSLPFEVLRSSIAALYDNREFNLVIRVSEDQRLFVEQSRLYEPSVFGSDWMVEDPKGELYDGTRVLSNKTLAAVPALLDNRDFNEALNGGVAASFVVATPFSYYVITTTPIFDVNEQLAATLISYHVSPPIAGIYRNFAVELSVALLFSVLLAGALTVVANRIHKVREQRQRIAAITDAVQSGIYVMDRRGNTIFVNRRAEEILGYPAADMLGVSAHEQFHDHPAPKLDCPVFQVIDTKQKYQNEEMFIRSNGESFPVTVASAPVTLAAGEPGAVVVFDDISERKRLEAQLLQAQKMESVGTLAGGIAHDFNNILSSVSGYAWLTLNKMEKVHPLRRYLEQVLVATERATSLTRDLLLFSRKQAGHVAPFDLNDIFPNAVDFWRRTLGSEVRLHIHPAGEPLPVRGDFHQIQQVLMNLIINARDAMPRGGEVTVSATAEKIGAGDALLANEFPEGTYAKIRVVDSGDGIEPEVLEHIFEPFFTTKSTDKGTGLGLAVVYGIVRQHGGFVRVDSVPARGTIFDLYLPITREHIVRPGAKAQEEQFPKGDETILLAEDDAQVRDAMTEVLTDAGYRVIVAVDGVQAVELFNQSPGDTDLLLFDIIMPRLNGKDAADKIRQQYPDKKLLFLSGYAPEALRQKVDLDQGCQIINKPVKPQVLLQTIRDILDENHQK